MVVVDPKAALARGSCAARSRPRQEYAQREGTAERYARQLWSELTADSMVVGMNAELKASSQLPFDQQMMENHPLFSLAIEGTTPSYARLYEPNKLRRDAGRVAASCTRTAMRALGPSTGRAIKDLSSLG
eukprot:2598701-Prymnesium_polylepis.1